MSKKNYYIGVDLGGSYTKIGLVNRFGKIIAKTVLTTNRYKRNQLIDEIVFSVKSFCLKKKIKTKDISGIGVGLPGLIDSRKGIVRYLVNIPGWKNVHMKRLLESKLKIKTFLDNDENVMTLGELHYGAGKNVKNLVCITLGTGVGGGIVINGKLYRGTDLVAGEIGHIPISESGPKCNCGGTGCIESYIGNRYLRKKLKRDLKKQKSLVKNLIKKSNYRLSLKLVDKAAKMGDRFAIEFWKDVGIKLGIMLTGVINFINPERIIIGGGVANAGKFLFGPLGMTINKRAMKIQRKSVKIVKARLGEDAGVIGAAVLAKERDIV